ncbi:MAG TPA: hypothetical protein VHL05_14960 [Terriglobales bacterium]|jgi:hypothetical protein|nr:hypothetical protein [Terriglobales bacterium]
MSYIRMAPQVVTTEVHTCQFHKDHPGGQWAGCTCSMAVHSRDKTPAEMTEAERRFMSDPYPGAYIPSTTSERP